MTRAEPPIAPRRLITPRRLIALGVVVLANAALQAVLVAVAPPLPLSGAAIALAIASGMVLLGATATCWWIAGRGLAFRRRLGPLVLAGLIIVVVAVVLPPLVPVVIPLGCAVVAGGGVRGAIGVARRHPWRFTALALATLLAVVLAWAAALLLGLFVTGAPAAATTWVLAGAGSAVLIVAWNDLTRDRHRA